MSTTPACPTLVRSLRRPWSLPASDWLLLLEAYLQLLLVDIGMRLLGTHRTARLAARVSVPPPTPQELRRALRFTHWLHVASRRNVIRAECLHRSLALHHWLRRQHIPSTLEIGVRRSGGHLLAHAWVRVGEHVLGDAPAQVANFAPLRAGGHNPWN